MTSAITVTTVARMPCPVCGVTLDVTTYVMPTGELQRTHDGEDRVVVHTTTLVQPHRCGGLR